MPRPVKWSRDLHAIQERALRSKTETWSRLDIEDLFNVGRVSAQTLMKAIGEIQSVGGAHFVERSALLTFLGKMVEAQSVNSALRDSLIDAPPLPRPKRMRVPIPEDLRNAMIENLPPSIQLSAGRLVIESPNCGQVLSCVEILECLAVFARVLENDLDRVRMVFEPPSLPPPVTDNELNTFLARVRATPLSGLGSRRNKSE